MTTISQNQRLTRSAPSAETRTLENAKPVQKKRPSASNGVQPGFEPAQPPKVVLNPVKPAVDPAPAIDKARELLSRGASSATTIPNGVITNDAPSANDAGDVTGPRAKEALGQVLDNAELEAAALEKLSETDRASYQTVKGALLEPADGKPNGDPVAALALQTMLLEGSLPGAKALGGDETLLGGLETLATQPVGAGIDQRQLLADVVQEVATPESIAQTERGTCMPTSIEIQLAQKNPAEYVRLVAGLASTAGEVKTVGGDTLKVEPDALTDGTTRTLSQRLLAPALMEVANGRADYNNTIDRSVDGNNQQLGLTFAQGDRLLESLYGRDFAFSQTGSAQEKAAGTEYIVGQVKNGESVVAGLTWESGGHAVLVTGTETRDGQQYVTITNPWGREESIRLDEFEKRLLGVNYDPTK